MLSAVVVLTLIAIAFGLLLGYAAIRFKVEGILPQTQCGQCGYAGCRPYAEAIANEEADINQCPPGGETVILALADLLGRDPKPLSEEHGVEKPKMVAVIDEQTCIGCTLCIQACPVDCIHMVEVKSDLHSWKWPYPATPEHEEEQEAEA